jgi:hypothetical protein
MSGEIREWVVKSVGTVIVILIVVQFFNSLFTSPLSSKPGEPFYPAQESLEQVLGSILVLLSPGPVGAAAVIIGLLYVLNKQSRF